MPLSARRATAVLVANQSVLLPLPRPTDAPGIRDGIRDLAQWKMQEITPGWGAVEPAEGRGHVYQYFRVHKLCDAQSHLNDETWAPLRRNPAFSRVDVSVRTSPVASAADPDWQKRLLQWGDKVAASGRRGAELAAVSAMLTALDPGDVPAYLQGQMPIVFNEFKDGSLWFFEVDPLLAHRIGLLRVLLALETIPDYIASTKPDLPQIRTLQEHTLTGGTAFEKLIDPLLLSIPPASLGYSWSWMPHGLVFLFGFPALLIEEHPPTLASLYAPRLHGSEAGFHWRESDFFENVATSDIEALLQWWVSRLNVIYSYATDPTNFADAQGRFSAARHTVWLMTFERLVSDALSIGSSPQASALSRVETAFDLFDKAESLLGYRKDRTGKGFQRLLRRNEMVPHLEAIWDERLPLQLRQRFKAHTRHLYDRIYEHARKEAYGFRLTTNGINVWSSREQRLIEWSWDAFVPRLIRAVRNSAHGLMETFEGNDRDLVVAHTGEMAPELPELAAFLVLAFVANAERLCSGTWLD
jgi:hypothetical protein